MTELQSGNVPFPEDIVFPKPVERQMGSKEFMAAIEAEPVPEGRIAIWTIGQNGYVLKTDEGMLIGIDPYLTDYSAGGRTGVRNEKSRILPVFIEPEDFRVDLLLLTHSHHDHADPFTLERYRHKDRTSVLAPWQAARVAEQAGFPETGILLMHPLQERSVDGVKITGTFAEPTGTDDLNHMGFVLSFGNGRTYYNSGDTAKSELLGHVKQYGIDFMTICINGGYHNLSHWEAAEITALIQPKTAAPAHFDMMPHNVQPPHMFRKSLSVLAPEVEYRKLEYYRPELF